MKQNNAYKILIVEDETIIAEDLKTFLQDSGYNVIGVVSTGLSALEIYREQEPDIILMDIVLDDDMNGIEAANQMQEIRRTPVVFLTALKHEIIISNLKHSMAYKHILKPFKDSELIKTIESMLQDNRRQDEESVFRNRVKLIFNKISEGIIILSKTGNIVYTNEVIDNLLETKENRLVNEALFYLSNTEQEKEITLEVKDKSIPCLARSLMLGWDDEYFTLLLIKDLSDKFYKRKLYNDLEKKYSAIEKKLGIGSFVINNKEDSKFIEVNSAFVKKLQFKQYSDMKSKKFSDLLKDNKDFKLFLKKLTQEEDIIDHKAVFIDKNGTEVKADLMAKLKRTPKDEVDLIEGLVFFLN